MPEIASSSLESMSYLRPFIKWVGGKTQLLSVLENRIPSTYSRYFEPFLGGGALLFSQRPEQAFVSDTNPVLIQAYLDVRDHPQELMRYTHKLDILLQAEGLTQKEQNDYYLGIRETFNAFLKKREYGLQSSGLFLFLNKHAFNGLYRTNRKGAFNAPFAYSIRDSFQAKNILAVSSFLRTHAVSLFCQDFEKTCEDAGKGDFVFFDSPYAPLTDTSFVSYTKEGFSKDDHIRLARLAKKLSDRGASVMVTNHNTPFIRELYDGFSMEAVSVHRNINRDGKNRYGEELIITSR